MKFFHIENFIFHPVLIIFPALFLASFFPSGKMQPYKIIYILITNLMH